MSFILLATVGKDNKHYVILDSKTYKEHRRFKILDHLVKYLSNNNLQIYIPSNICQIKYRVLSKNEQCWFFEKYLKHAFNKNISGFNINYKDLHQIFENLNIVKHPILVT